MVYILLKINVNIRIIIKNILIDGQNIVHANGYIYLFLNIDISNLLT